MNAAHLRLAWLLVLLILPGVSLLAIAGTGALDITARYCRNLALGRVQLMDADRRVLLSGRRDLGDALAFGTHPGILGSDSTAVIRNLLSGAATSSALSTSPIRMSLRVCFCLVTAQELRGRITRQEWNLWLRPVTPSRFLRQGLPLVGRTCYIPDTLRRVLRMIEAR